LASTIIRHRRHKYITANLYREFWGRRQCILDTAGHLQ
jgi:hypothetical protein